MKSRFVFAQLFAFAALLPVFGEVAVAEEPADSAGVVLEYIENAGTKIIKVYSIHDGDFRSQNYVIEWKGQEVVVRDSTHSLRRVRPGDPMRIQVRKEPNSRGRHPEGLLSFRVAAPRLPADATPPPRHDPREQPRRRRGIDYGTFTTEVRHVYAASDGPHLFRAYVIEWKGEETIVYDNVISTNHGVGDTVTVFFSFHRPREGFDEMHGSMTLSAVPATIVDRMFQKFHW